MVAVHTHHSHMEWMYLESFLNDVTSHPPLSVHHHHLLKHVLHLSHKMTEKAREMHAMRPGM